MSEGLEAIRTSAALIRVSLTAAVFNLGSVMFGAVYLIFFYRHLHLGPALVGGVLVTWAASSLVGALSAQRIVHRLGIGRALLIAVLIGGLSVLCFPLALIGPAIPVIIAAGVINAFGGPLFNVTAVSLRQTITPDQLLGRVIAATRTLVYLTLPIGAVLGGLFANAIGVAPTIIIAGVICCCASLVILPGGLVPFAPDSATRRATHS